MTGITRPGQRMEGMRRREEEMEGGKEGMRGREEEKWRQEEKKVGGSE